MPDLPKLIRSTEDALTDAGMWTDDARIVRCRDPRKVNVAAHDRTGSRLIHRPGRTPVTDMKIDGKLPASAGESLADHARPLYNQLGDTLHDVELARLRAALDHGTNEMSRVVHSSVLTDGEIRHKVDRIHQGLNKALHPALETEDTAE